MRPVATNSFFNSLVPCSANIPSSKYSNATSVPNKVTEEAPEARLTLAIIRLICLRL